MRPVESGSVPSSKHPVKICGLRAGYGDKTVLDGLQLELPCPGLTAIVGPGGSGKSTLVRALSDSRREEFWWEGSVEVPPPGVAVQFQSPVSEQGTLADVLAGTEDSARSEPVALTRFETRGMPRTADWLRSALDQPISELSRSRVRLARVLAILDLEASLYIFDEPDAELATDLVAELEPVFLELKRLAAVLVITHNLGFARRISDHAALMEEGKLIEYGSAHRFFTEPELPRTRQFLQFGS